MSSLHPTARLLKARAALCCLVLLLCPIAAYRVAFLLNARATAAAEELGDQSTNSAGEPAAQLPLWVWGLAFSPDGTLLASCAGQEDERGALTLWDLASGRPKWIHGETKGIPGVAFSPDGSQIAIGGYDGIAKLVDAGSGEVLATLQGHSVGVSSVAFSPDGKTLATAGLDRVVKLWDLSHRAEMLKLEGHTDMVFSVAFSPDGSLLASAGADRVARLWDVATGREMRNFAGHFMWRIQQVVFSPDGSTLATAGYDGSAKVWQVETGRLWCTLKGPRGSLSQVSGVAFGPESGTLATCRSDKTVKFYEIHLPQQRPTAPAALRRAIKKLDDDSFEVREAASRELATLGFAAERELLAATGSDEPRELRVRATRLLEALYAPPASSTLQAHSAPIQFLTFSPDGQRLATACSDGTVKLWDADTLAELATLKSQPPAQDSDGK